MNSYTKYRDNRKHDTRISAVRCKACKTFTVGPEMGLCPKCMKPPVPRDHNGDRRRAVVVLKCPRGIYTPGEASFTREQFRLGLLDGIWPLGMIVRNEGGDFVCVCGKGKHYREPVVVLPRQWIVAL